jgi:hypothetical protein
MTLEASTLQQTNTLRVRPRILVRAVVAAAVTAALNLVAFAVGTAAGASMTVTMPSATEIGVIVVIVASTAPALFAGAATWLLARWRPVVRVWAAWVGLAFGVLSAPATFIAASDTVTAIALASMHVMAGVVWFIALAWGAMDAPRRHSGT